MIRSHWAAVLFLLGIVLPVRGEEVAPSTAPAFAFEWRQEGPPSFGVGEHILYVVKYGVIPAGFATLHVTSTQTIAGRGAYHIYSEAKTNKGFDVVFKVRDKNQSWIDAQSLCSLQFMQDMREGGYRRQVETTFDHPARRFVYKKWRKGKESVQEGTIPPFIQDVLSSLYYIRSRPLEVGKEYSLDANSGAKTWSLSIRVAGKERIHVPAGRFDCLHLEPILMGEGIFQAEGRLEVWVTEAPPHIPVLLRSRVAVGAFDAEMQDYRPGVPAPPGSVN